MKTILRLLLLVCISISSEVNAQCSAGQEEVTINVKTDTYAFESYWQLLPSANNCGTGTIFAGGNTAVGCNGGGASNQLPGGYGNNITISEGPWCLTSGSTYKIYSVDDYGDGGTKFTVNIAGFPMYNFSETSTNSSFSFTSTLPPVLDGSLLKINTTGYVYLGTVYIKGEIKNLGQTAITSMTLNYSIDNASAITQSLSTINIAPYTEFEFSHSTIWSPSDTGTYLLKVWISNINGQSADANAANDIISKTIIVKTPVPNIIPSYTLTSNTFTFKVIGTSANSVNIARDLDFAPNGDLWIINKGTENSGGSTVTFTNPGKTNQTSAYKQDGNAKHFMSLPTAIAFSDNENFATSPGVYDANHDGGSPFTGPSLWSSDPAIYAQPSGGNGSHLDMLHESPYSMGIAFEEENAFWLFDGNSKDIVRYDFGLDHGPGNDDHSDGIVKRYTGFSLSRLNDHIVCHLTLDKNSGWLYIVDGGNKRVVRLNTKSGTSVGTPSFGAYESLAEYSNVDGATWEIVVDSGLVQPAGIDIIENRMLVTDYNNGDIIVYDISTMPAVELGRLATGEPGIMGLVIGPNGRIWYVNATLNKVVTIEPSQVILSDKNEITLDRTFYFYPNPSKGICYLQANYEKDYSIRIYNTLGKMVQILNRSSYKEHTATFDISELHNGYYFMQILDGNRSLIETTKIILIK